MAVDPAGPNTVVATAPAVDWKKYLPTRKWWAALVTGLAAIAANWIESGAFDDVERGMGAALIVALAGGYFKSNAETPGGVTPAPEA